MGYMIKDFYQGTSFWNFTKFLKSTRKKINQGYSQKNENLTNIRLFISNTGCLKSNDIWMNCKQQTKNEGRKGETVLVCKFLIFIGGSQ